MSSKPNLSFTVICKLIFVTTIYSFITFAGNGGKTVVVHAVRTQAPIKIDGKLTESVWNTAPGITGFLQRDPDEGKAATEKTIVKILYDQSAIYIGARMYDHHPDSIIARLARKDYEVNADKFTVYLDPYHDKRTGYYFSLSAAGTFYDGVLYNDDFQDGSWDGVWNGKVTIDNKGWTAEFRIPFSQLRFEKSDTVWGVDFSRVIARKHETDFLVYTPKNESGFVSRFAELQGLKNLNPSSDIEIVPYVTTKAEYTRPEPGNPFNNNGQEYTPDVGVDIKAGLGTNLKLNLSVNPDFGQVEIDPAVLNLTDVETFFVEKRPFFTEGSSIFNFGVGGSVEYWNFDWPNPDFFYSRRIGRTPQGSLPPYDYADIPDGTHILGAAKLTGKIGNNFSVGAISALTQREYANISYQGKKLEVAIEPLTYYGVFRGQNEFNQGSQGLGFISTITTRFFQSDALRNQLNEDAYTGGIDGWTFLDDSKTWVLSGWGGLSYVRGTKQRILDFQTDPVHYFQRPDSKYLGVDSNATSMLGYSGRLTLNKQKGNTYFNSAIGFISPKFDINDLGYLTNANVINFHVGGGYQWTQPKAFYRMIDFGTVLIRDYNYDGNINYQEILHYGKILFSNYYLVSWNIGLNLQSYNDRLTRGGPLTQNPVGYIEDFEIQSDTSNNWLASMEVYTNQNHFSNYWGFAPVVNYIPSANVSVSLSPFYEINNDYSQYLMTVNDPTALATYGKRYIFGELKQRTLGASIELSWTFTPNLSLQFFAQPLVSVGRYNNIKELKEPGTYSFLVYGQDGSTFDKTTYVADPDGPGPAPPIDIGNPDFNYVSLRGNAVLRWEYSPGSVVYFVWTQSRFSYAYDSMFGLGHAASGIFNLHPDNIFLIKLTHWFSF